MKLQFIDTHAHLFGSDYPQDLDAVLNRAKEAGLQFIIVPGTNQKTSEEALLLSEMYDFIFACVGIHPHEALNTKDEDLDQIEKLSRHPKVVAIGEIGLDYYYDFTPKEKQKMTFKAQLEIAARRKLPVVVNSRESMEDTFSIIRNLIDSQNNFKNKDLYQNRGVFHCFPGTQQEASIANELGFFVSFPGIVTFKKSQSLDVIKHIGLQNILLETDSPYMSPVPVRGKRNEPANIVFIAKKIASALNVSENEVAAITSKNAISLFNLPQE